MTETVKQMTKDATKAASETASVLVHDFTVTTQDITSSVRKVAEEGVTQMRKAYDSVKDVAENTTDMLENTFANASDGWSKMNLKVLDNFKAQTDANFALARALFSAKTPAEAFETQVSFARDRMQTMTRQAQEFAALAGDVASATAAPVKSTLVKAMKSAAKVA